MIFAPYPYLINRVIDFIYIFYNRKSCTNFRWIPIQELDEIVSDHFGSGDTQRQSTNDVAELQENPG